MTLFNFIKSQLAIFDVVQDFVSLKKAGHYWKGRCPFHKERTGSFTVSPHKEIFYCFGCQAGGDVISFMSRVEHCSQLEAAHYLIERYKLTVPAELLDRSKGGGMSTDERKRYWSICAFVANWCHDQALTNRSVLSYLHSRGISDGSTQNFNLGHFPKGSRSVQQLIHAAKEKNILVHDLLQAHIVIEGKKGLYSPFEDRIIFPIKDYIGNVCGFGGRVFRAGDERPKYYNSREHTYFEKGSLLFGLDSAKRAMGTDGSVFLVEGYTDCIAMVQHGYPNTVATLGTACTMHHVKLVSRYAQTMYVLYDGDSAGQQAMLRLAQNCWDADMELMQIPVPADSDPASYVNAHGTIKPLLQQAQDIFSFYINNVTANYHSKTLQQKMRIARKLIGLIGGLDDELKRDILLQKASKTLDMPFETLRKELERSRAKPSKIQKSSVESPEPELSLQPVNQQNENLADIPELEKKLFSVIINNVQKLREEEVGYLTAYLTKPLPELLGKLIACMHNDEATYFTDFFTKLTEQEKQLVSQLTIQFHPYEHQHNLPHLFAQFQKQHWKKFVTDVKHQLMSAKQRNNNQEVAKILSHFQSLKTKLLHKGLI